MKQPVDKKLYITLPILIAIIISVTLTLYLQRNNTNIDPNLNPTTSQEDTNQNEDTEMNTIYLTTNNNRLDVILEDNPSTKALLDKLESGAITINAEDYGGFEKVGALGFSLPTNDEQMTTIPGDLVLYEGDKLTLHYGSNTWSYTKIGHIDILPDDLQAILGSSNLVITLSLKGEQNE